MYTPGTVLRFANGETATVLTNGNVLAQKDNWRQIMSLEDWKCLGTPLTPVLPAHVDSPVWAAHPQCVHDMMAEVKQMGGAPAPAPEPTPVRTTYTSLRWSLDDETYRIAIVIPDGILQVKSVTEGKPEYMENGWRGFLAKKRFATEDEWRASLPEGGTITSKTPQERQASKAVKVSGNDVEKIEQLAKRYKVTTRIYQKAPAQRHQILLEHGLETCNARVHEAEKLISLLKAREQDVATRDQLYSAAMEQANARRDRRRTISQIRRINLAGDMCGFSETDSAQKLFVVLAQGIHVPITPASHVKWNSPRVMTGIYCGEMFYNSLEEINVAKDENGKPKIYASYRQGIIPLGHHF